MSSMPVWLPSMGIWRESFYADDAKPLYGGVANGNKPYVRTMTLPQALETIYIMQIDPRKGKSVKTVLVDPSMKDLACDFKPASAVGTTTKSLLRSGEDNYNSGKPNRFLPGFF